MAVNYFNNISEYEFSGFPIGFSRNNPIPLDKTEVWLDLEELRAYAATGATAYVGQKVTYVDVENKTATVYIIADTEGTLTPVGSPTEGDEVSISLNDGVLSLKDFGKRYYEFVAADGETAAHYEPVDVDADHPWSAGLTPKIVEEDGALVLGWFEPNETTIEGVQDQAVEALDKAEQAQEKIEEVSGKVTEVETKVTEVEDKVEKISDVLNDTVDENGETVEGLVTRTENLEADVADLQEAVADVYTKEEIDGKIASVFHYKGKKATYADLLLITDMVTGDVWEIEDEKKEYAYNGTEWIELGLTVDLSAYATSEYVDSKAETLQGGIDDLQDSIDEINTTVGEHTTTLGTYATDIQGLKDDLNPLKETVADMGTTIGTLESATTDFDTRVGTLEGYVGTPSGNLGALYPAVESLNSRVNDITTKGGEPNQINGISILGTALVPNEALIVDLPIFAGNTAGLIPAAEASIQANATNYFLNAAGLWANPFGDLAGKSVQEYVDNAVTSVAVVWESISE